MESNNRLKAINEFRMNRRNLPHFEEPGSVYFLTFHTIEGLILPNAAKDIVLDALKYHSEIKYKMLACVVMDTHVHSILQPLEISTGTYFSLSQITHSLKSYTANRIQRQLKIDGRIWQDETYDRVVRDENEYLEKAQYIIDNPLKAGLSTELDIYKWLYVDGFEESLK